jgi:hypothetical protein
MAFIAVPNTVRAEIRGTFQGERVLNTLWFAKIDAWVPAEMTALADTLAAWWTTNCLQQQSDQYTLREIYVRDYTAAVGLEYTSTVDLPAVGEIPEAALPNNVSLAVSFRSGFTGRSTRGRNYWVGFAETQIVGNAVADAVITDITSYYALLLPDFIETTLIPDITWVITSFYTGGAPRSFGATFIINTVTCVDNIVDSQRRRLPGRGI